MISPFLLSLALAGSPPVDDGPSADEVKLLLESVIPGERAAMQKTVGDLAKLPLYRVQATVDADAATFSGSVQIRYPAGKGVTELPLRVFGNAAYVSHGSPSVDVDKVTCPGQACTLSQPGDGTLFVVKFDPPVPAGGVAHLDLEFHGALPHLDPSRLTAQAQMSAQTQLLANRGGGPSDHGAFAEAEGVLALTGMFPQVAQRTAEGFDTGTPTGVGDVDAFDLSNYLFTAKTAGSATIIAGGSKLGEAPTPDGQMQATYAAAAVRDFPLYVSKRLTATTAQSGAIKVTAYTLPGDEPSGKKVLDVAVRSLKEFARRFGSYPWKEFKVVEQSLTDGAGGIEHPTVVSVGSIIYRTQNAMGPLAALATPPPQLGSHTANLGVSDKVLEFSVAHEVAHQWWSGLVGSDARLDPSADEPLAQYSAVLYLEARRGKDAAKEAIDEQIAVGYQMMRQAGEPDGSADQPTGAFSSPLQYAGLIYGKAPLFYRAARKQLGDGTFDKVLARYAARNRFGDVGSEAFVEAARDVAPKQAKTIGELHEHWFVEMHGDEDLGKLDYGKMLESSTGMKISPQEKQMMQQLMPQLMQMMKDGADPSQLMQQMQQKQGQDAPPPGGAPQQGGTFQP